MPDFTTQILRVSEKTSRSSGVLLDFLMKEWASEPSCELSSTAHAARPCMVVIRNAPEDVAPHGHAVDRATVRQRKTGQPVRFEMTEQTREAIDNYIRAANKKPDEFLFGGRRGRDLPITTQQYARLVGQWIAAIGLDPGFFGTHSLRRTKATLIYRRTGNLRAVQLLLGHGEIESTVRYLGIEVDDALAIAEHVDV